eukprot:m.330412 g.330412  ORF g.330412 m.330412 type:complete len:239 (-) comp20460_c1_seq8:1971-2687(-)
MASASGRDLQPRIVPRTSWQDDKDADVCSEPICGVSFTLSRRRHHCRYCGRVFCDVCSNKKVNGMRMCGRCHEKTFPTVSVAEVDTSRNSHRFLVGCGVVQATISHPLQPVHRLELCCEVGDRVVVRCTVDEHWVIATSESNGLSGLVPLACLACPAETTKRLQQCSRAFEDLSPGIVTAVVLNDVEGGSARELSVAQGDVVCVRQALDDTWAVCTHPGAGVSGLVPLASLRAEHTTS